MSRHRKSKVPGAPSPAAAPPRKRLALTWVDWRARVQWFAAEFLIVVTGVLVALAVQAWWVERAERREERQVLASLLEEARANRARIAEVIAGAEQGLADVSRFYALTPDELAAVPKDTAMSVYLESMWRPFTYELKDGALTGATNSGQLKLLRDPAVRSALNEWRGQTGDLEERTRNLVELEREALVALGRHGVMRDWFLGSPSLVAAEVDLRPIRDDTAVLAIATAMQHQRAKYISALRQLQEQLDATSAVLGGTMRNGE